MMADNPIASSHESVRSSLYDAFISYSHAADARLATALQSHLTTFAKPWYRLRSMHVFRDETSLTASPYLWSDVAAHLDDSAYFILLASSTSADSKWVKRELCYWITGGRCDDPDLLRPEEIKPERAARVLIVLTEGRIAWNDAGGEGGDFDWSQTTALPCILSHVFVGEPCWIDLSWARVDGASKLDRSHRVFMQAIARLSAPIRGLDIEVLVGEDQRELDRQMRHFRRLSIGLATTALVAVGFGIYALTQRNEAASQKQKAMSETRSAKHNLAVDDLSHADFAIRQHQTANALNWYCRASEDAPVGSWSARSALNLLGAKGGSLQATIVHDGYVSAASFSRDGSTVLTASYDETARLWDARTGQPRSAALKHNSLIVAAALSPDGQTVLTGSFLDKTARLWDALSGQIRGEPMKHDGWINVVAFSPDGQTVPTGSFDKTARLWDAHNGHARGAPMKHDDSVEAVAFSPDSQTVLTGSKDKTARRWDASTGLARGEPMKHDSWVTTVAFSPDGQTLLTSTCSEARLWDASTGELRGEPIKYDGWINAVAFSPDSQMVLTGGGEPHGHVGVARLWHAINGQGSGEPMKHDDEVFAVAFSPDGQTVLTGSSDETARLWRIPPPAANEPERLKLSVDVRTGSKFDEGSGTIKRLTRAEWLERQERLWKEFGGPCDVRTWDNVSDAEKQQLRTPSKSR